MHKLFLIVTVLSITQLQGQSRRSRISVDVLTNFYSYGGEEGHLNSTVRLGEGLAINFATYDSSKKRSAMIYELATATTSGFL